ncbi:MAG: hypothetical protein IKD45_03390 [Clostridia bacterium]|nr:hypothetical protein [Clostridia bacterium]
MQEKSKLTHIAYRCPECGDVIMGLVGKFALSADMLRLKCSCGGSALTVSVMRDGRLKLSVPCVLCKEEHSFTISESLFFARDLFVFNCPYANIDIAFVGTRDNIDLAIKGSEAALSKLVADMGAEVLEDIQPMDMNDDEILPDAAVYDLIRFVVKDLEAEGEIDCPCHSGCYDLRYAPGGIEAYCPDCGATYLFRCESAAAAEEYINVRNIKLG